MVKKEALFPRIFMSKINAYLNLEFFSDDETEGVGVRLVWLRVRISCDGFTDGGARPAEEEDRLGLFLLLGHIELLCPD